MPNFIEIIHLRCRRRGVPCETQMTGRVPAWISESQDTIHYTQTQHLSAAFYTFPRLVVLGESPGPWTGFRSTVSTWMRYAPCPLRAVLQRSRDTSTNSSPGGLSEPGCSTTLFRGSQVPACASPPRL